ncbi:hypothetical protein ACLMAJ_00035 [Nocardia sp. KC 131]|uniref:hypothetical protein n=1 Tax=Nocardia arseniciresistens TaxID=3392119 RepID=UPI00398F5EE6
MLTQRGAATTLSIRLLRVSGRSDAAIALQFTRLRVGQGIETDRHARVRRRGGQIAGYLDDAFGVIRLHRDRDDAAGLLYPYA